MPNVSRWYFVAVTLVFLYYYFLLPSSSNLRIQSKGSVSTKKGNTGDYWQPKKWSQKVVAVGDLHGDLERASKVLRMAGVVDHRNRWIGKNTILGESDLSAVSAVSSCLNACEVQTGDIVDRVSTLTMLSDSSGLRSQGKDTIALYHLFDHLRAQADKAGGAVISLLGNHEMM